jgi:hypothetical protein
MLLIESKEYPPMLHEVDIGDMVIDPFSGIEGVVIGNTINIIVEWGDENYMVGYSQSFISDLLVSIREAYMNSSYDIEKFKQMTKMWFTFGLPTKFIIKC